MIIYFYSVKIAEIWRSKRKQKKLAQMNNLQKGFEDHFIELNVEILWYVKNLDIAYLLEILEACSKPSQIS